MGKLCRISFIKGEELPGKRSQQFGFVPVNQICSNSIFLICILANALELGVGMKEERQRSHHSCVIFSSS